MWRAKSRSKISVIFGSCLFVRSQRGFWWARGGREIEPGKNSHGAPWSGALSFQKRDHTTPCDRIGLLPRLPCFGSRIASTGSDTPWAAGPANLP